MGYIKSTDGDIPKNNGAWDTFVMKINSLGNKEWVKTYGGSNDDKAVSIIQKDDGKYIIAGSTNSIDGDISGNKGGTDVLIIKLDESE